MVERADKDTRNKDKEVFNLASSPQTSVPYGRGVEAETELEGHILVPQEIQDEDEGEEIISDLPQVVTESYGTGVKTEPGMNIGDRRLRDGDAEYTLAGPELTAQDIDAAWEQAATVGDEAVGGTVATPDQDIVDNIAAAIGTEMDDRQDFYGSDMYNQRDDRRWELDPMSSDDYKERREDYEQRPEREPSA